MVRISLVFLLISTPALSEPKLDDPTRPPNYSQTSSANNQLNSEKLVLSGIFNKNGSFEALINNNVYRKGDHIGLSKVASVNANSVVLKGEAGRIVLSLVKPIKKLKKK